MELKAVDIKTVYNAGAKPLNEIFGNADAFYEVPDYQRPYSWGEDEIQDLWDDIYTAYMEKREVYFLGSIIVAKSAGNYKEVIDGQQRLTTLIILFCTIRDLYTKENDISIGSVNDAIKSSRGQAFRLRLKTRVDYQLEFNQEILEGIKFSNTDKNKQNKFIMAANIFKKDLEDNFTEDITKLNDFIDYLFTNVAMVLIECSDRASAIHLFQILNTRGLQLHNSDLIKSYLYRRLDESKKEEFNAAWSQIGQLAKSLDEDLDNLFTYYEYYLLGSNPKKSLYEELEAQFNKRDSSEVIYDFKQFVDNLEELISTTSATISSLKYLRNQVFWKAITLTAKKEGFLQLDDLIKQLRRFFYCYWIAGYTTSKIKQTSFNLITMVKNKRPLEEITSEIEKKLLKDKVVSKVYENLNDHNVYYKRWIKPLLLLIEDRKIDESKVSFYKLKKLDADHILPLKWNKIPEWRKDWTEADAKAYLSTLGNLTLIMFDKNRSAQNKPFEEKRDIYNGLGKYEGKTAFKISEEVANELTWKKEQVIARQKRILTEIKNILNIDFNQVDVIEEDV